MNGRGSSSHGQTKVCVTFAVESQIRRKTGQYPSNGYITVTKTLDQLVQLLHDVL